MEIKKIGIFIKIHVINKFKKRNYKYIKLSCL